MAGQSYTEMNVGDPCWVLVDKVNDPVGTWHGVVLEIVKHADDPEHVWYSIKAKLDDGRLADMQRKDPHGSGRFFDQEPCVNYRVLPDTEDIRSLLGTIQRHAEANDRLAKECFLYRHLLLDGLRAGIPGTPPDRSEGDGWPDRGSGYRYGNRGAQSAFHQVGGSMKTLKDLWGVFDQGDPLSDDDLARLIENVEAGIAFFEARGETGGVLFKARFDLERLKDFQRARANWKQVGDESPAVNGPRQNTTGSMGR